MPIYVFRCPSCGHEFEELVRRMGDTAPCPKCGRTEVERKVTAPVAPRSGTAAPPGCGGSPPECGFS